jgi:hypothetical protein
MGSLSVAKKKARGYKIFLVRLLQKLRKATYVGNICPRETVRLNWTRSRDTGEFVKICLEKFGFG